MSLPLRAHVHLQLPASPAVRRRRMARRVHARPPRLSSCPATEAACRGSGLPSHADMNLYAAAVLIPAGVIMYTAHGGLKVSQAEPAGAHRRAAPPRRPCPPARCAEPPC